MKYGTSPTPSMAVVEVGREGGTAEGGEGGREE